MVTYPIEFPAAISLSALSITPRDSVTRNASPFTYSEQVYDWGGEMWTIEGSLPLMDRNSAAIFQAFLLKLKGKKGTFLFPVPEATPRGVATGTPLVDGAAQVGSSLDIKGVTNSVTGIYKAGDWLQLGAGVTTRLYMVLDDADSNGSGLVTVNLWPSLRSSPADSAAVVVAGCKGLFRLSDNVGWNKDNNKHFSMQFSAMEALNGS